MRRLLAGLALLACRLARAGPLRFVSLAPSLTEIMLELQAGDLLVGVLVAAIAAKGGFDILRDARLARRDAESSVT